MIANLVLNFATVYAAIGCLVAAAFLIFGLDRIDPTARGAYAFRPLLIPGSILLWPVVLWRWRRLSST